MVLATSLWIPANQIRTNTVAAATGHLERCTVALGSVRAVLCKQSPERHPGCGVNYTKCGFEPQAIAFTGYQRFRLMKSGNRTRVRLIISQLLYPLSYLRWS